MDCGGFYLRGFDSMSGFYTSSKEFYSILKSGDNHVTNTGYCYWIVENKYKMYPKFLSDNCSYVPLDFRNLTWGIKESETGPIVPRDSYIECVKPLNELLYTIVCFLVITAFYTLFCKYFCPRWLSYFPLMVNPLGLPPGSEDDEGSPFLQISQ